MKQYTSLKYKNKLCLALQPNTTIKTFINKRTIYQEIKTLTKRLYIQTYRRPSSIITSMLQPLLWLILFSALFQNAPINIFEEYKVKYNEFLSPGIIIFTAFTSSINAGLPIVFDREFGFLNRLLSSPLTYKNSFFISCLMYTWIIAIMQITTIVIFSIFYSKYIININQFLATISITTLIIFNIASVSIYNAFVLPGHIEFIALSFIINLPTLFSSTALSPLYFMPNWLQFIACINPLTYAIEITRYIFFHKKLILNEKIVNTIWFSLKTNQSIYILIIFNILSLLLVYRFIKYRYD
uniref:ABC transmembrane type-2 domain-containing protein n=1 Tax=Dasyclonium flaccidum TaxID=2007274 RepID=A0A1Z1ML85_9FLOR|nr:hypothetical protein [Dasyclonium flaccidum]ARW66696.1 hypothetical protein [Dasyclonium flaccidum]